MIGKREKNEFTLDLFNCMANKKSGDLIRQVIEGAGDSMSRHIFYLTKPHYEADGSKRIIIPSCDHAAPIWLPNH